MARSVAVAASSWLFVALGCNAILGIESDYHVRERNMGGAGFAGFANHGGAGAGAAGGHVGAGTAGGRAGASGAAGGTDLSAGVGGRDDATGGAPEIMGGDANSSGGEGPLPARGGAGGGGSLASGGRGAGGTLGSSGAGGALHGGNATNGGTVTNGGNAAGGALGNGGNSARGGGTQGGSGGNSARGGNSAAGGSASVDCAALQAQLPLLRDDASVCDPSSTEECTFLPDGCGCGFFPNLDSPAGTAYRDALATYKAACKPSCANTSGCGTPKYRNFCSAGVCVERGF